MVAARKRPLPPENSADIEGNVSESDHVKSSNGSPKEEGKKTLGTLHVSLNLNSECLSYTRINLISSPITGHLAADHSQSPTPRRSSRLKKFAPVDYSETRSGSDEEALVDDCSESDEEAIADSSESDDESFTDDSSDCFDEQIESSGVATTSEYEKSRNERIKENQERMKNLGILQLSLSLKSECTRIKPVRPSKMGPLAARNPTTPAPPPRRSSRLQNIAPANCFNNRVETVGEPLADDPPNWHCEEPMKEVYTEEHEKLLGTSVSAWNLFEDGYDSNGKRIYDEVKGKTCHQCRISFICSRTTASRVIVYVLCW